jgi:branched-chain amino acid transport system substrate-binding protein
MSNRLQTPITRRTVTKSLGAIAAAGSLPSVAFGADPQPLRVAVLLPRTGFLAPLGQACQRGADLAGPILKDLGYPEITILPGDTESNPARARAAAEKAVGDGAHILVGAFSSGETAAVAQVAEASRIPLVVNIAAAPQITEQGYKYIFRNFPTGPRAITDALTLQKQLFAATGSAPKNCVVMAINDTFGSDMQRAIPALVPKASMPYQVVEVISYDPRAADLSGEVAKAKATGADLLWPVSRLNDAILIVREMVKQRWSPQGIIATGPGYYEDPFRKSLGKYAEFIVSILPWHDPKKPLTQKLLAAAARAYPNVTVDTYIAFTFEAVLIAADAFKRARKTDAEALVEALRTTDIADNVTIGDRIKFDPKGQHDVGSATIQIRDGTPKVVLPSGSAEVAPVFPMPNWDARN